MHELAVANGLAQVEMRPKIIGTQALEELAQRAGTCRQFRTTLAIAEQAGAIPIRHMHRPDVLDLVQPRLLLHVETDGFQLGLQGANGRFEGSVFAGDKGFGHGNS